MKPLLQFSVSLFFVITALGGDRREVKFSAIADKTAKARREAILAEIKKRGTHDWAGEYFAGDGRGVNIALTVAPRSGYVFEWNGCLGLYDRNYGALTSTDGRIRLSFTFENRREGFEGIAPEFVSVSWGRRRYLIPADKIIEFCNSVNDGREPRMGAQGSHLLRKGDEKKKAAGFPKVPKEFRVYLLAKPIEATIIAVGPRAARSGSSGLRFKDTKVTLNAGTQQKLRAGMELFVTKPEKTVESVRIIKVEENRAEANMNQFGNEPAPKRGWRLSTQAPWNAGRVK